MPTTARREFAPSLSPPLHALHRAQTFNWDCGLACIEMALRALGVSATECSLDQLREHAPATSVWTVDLAYVLREYGVRFRYLTLTLGADPAYKSEPFYSEKLEDDTKRVNRLFADAESRSVSIERRSLDAAELAALIRPQEHLVIALVDRRYLYQGTLLGLAESCVAHCLSAGYVGHYVLVKRFDEARAGYYIADPAKAADDLFVRAADLETARRAHGTDEDLIILPWGQTPTPPGRATGVTASGSATSSSGTGAAP